MYTRLTNAIADIILVNKYGPREAAGVEEKDQFYDK